MQEILDQMSPAMRARAQKAIDLMTKAAPALLKANDKFWEDNPHLTEGAACGRKREK